MFHEQISRKINSLKGNQNSDLNLLSITERSSLVNCQQYLAIYDGKLNVRVQQRGCSPLHLRRFDLLVKSIVAVLTHIRTDVTSREKKVAWRSKVKLRSFVSFHLWQKSALVKRYFGRIQSGIRSWRIQYSRSLIQYLVRRTLKYPFMGNPNDLFAVEKWDGEDRQRACRILSRVVITIVVIAPALCGISTSCMARVISSLR